MPKLLAHNKSTIPLKTETTRKAVNVLWGLYSGGGLITGGGGGLLIGRKFVFEIWRAYIRDFTVC